MRVALFGDSFLQYYYDSWCETVATDLNWKVMMQQGFPGGSQHTIYESFIDFSKIHKPDLILFCHTEPRRLANKHRLGINVVTAAGDAGLRMPEEVHRAASAYYEHIFHERFHTDIHDLLIRDIQEKCVEIGCRQIHLQSFNDKVTQTHGMWMNSSMFDLANTQPEGWVLDRKLRNHLSSDLNDRFAKWITPHIKWYMERDLDYHSITLYPEDIR
jgi:hypothetical protein